MTTQPTKPQYSELGASGFRTFGGQIQQEFLIDLQGVRGRRTYREMASNDPVLAGILFAIESAFRDRAPVVEPADGAGEEDEDARFLESCIDDMSHTWQDFMSDVVTMFTQGWSWFEVVYKRRTGEEADPPSTFTDGRVGWRKFAFRDQLTLDKWELDASGGVQGMWQRPPTMTASVLLPIGKSLHFKTKHAGGSPEGYSILRASYLPWYYRKNLQGLEAISLERIGAGIPVIKLPEGATDTDETNAKSAIRRFKVDEQMGFTLPNGWELELAFGGAGSRGITDGFEQAIVRYRQEMLISTLTQFIVLGMDKVGSYALSKTFRDFFQVALGGWLRSIEQVINRYAVKRLFALNGVVGRSLPRISLGAVGDADVQLIVDALAKLAPLGIIIPDDDLEGRVREVLDLPKAADTPRLIADGEGGGAADDGARPFRLDWQNYP